MKRRPLFNLTGGTIAIVVACTALATVGCNEKSGNKEAGESPIHQCAVENTPASPAKTEKKPANGKQLAAEVATNLSNKFTPANMIHPCSAHETPASSFNTDDNAKNDLQWLDSVEPDSMMYIRAVMWRLGRELTLLGFATAQRQDEVEELRAEIKSICDVIGVEVPQLIDEKGGSIGDGDEITRMAKAMSFALRVAPKEIAPRICKRYDKKACAAFEFGLKSHLIYVCTDDICKTSMADTLERLAKTAELPKPIWSPLIEALRNGDRSAINAALDRTRVQMWAYKEKVGAT